jgi:hypothetical protein
MAMYTVLRRAAAAVVPLAARRATVTSSSRTFHSALSVKLLLNNEINPFVPSRSFSNAVAKKPVADDNLVQILQIEIECALEEDEAGQVFFFSLEFCHFYFNLGFIIVILFEVCFFVFRFSFFQSKFHFFIRLASILD